MANNSLTFGSLFAGIGGLDLGFERAGLICKWQVEIDGFCRKVLAKHWPDVRRHDDVKTFPPASWLDGKEMSAEALQVDVICGGFPCQDISNAGKRAGIKEGTRSGLWSEYARIIRVVRPRFVVVENVSALLGWGMSRVLGDLAESGYDAEWDCLPAAAFGAPHERDRVFIFASYANCDSSGSIKEDTELESEAKSSGIMCRQSAYTYEKHGQARIFGSSGARFTLCCSRWGADKSGVDRASYGIPNRMDRNSAVGNAVVPQIAEWIGKRLMELV